MNLKTNTINTVLDNGYLIREAIPEEFTAIGQLMVDVYSQLDNFPSKEIYPEYYVMLANIGDLTRHPHTKLIVAVDEKETIGGAVIYFGDMQYYGSGGTATKEKHAAGFRLLAVANHARGKRLGKLLTIACIEVAREEQQQQLIIHTTDAMKLAWGMYERLGFKRSEDLDFMQGELAVYGFRLPLK